MSGEAVKLTKVRARILSQIETGDWFSWENFTSANSFPSLRRTTFARRKGRILPWQATAGVMEEFGWIETRMRPGWLRDIRITEAGRLALRDQP